MLILDLLASAPSFPRHLRSRRRKAIPVSLSMRRKREGEGERGPLGSEGNQVVGWHSIAVVVVATAGTYGR